MEQEVSMEEIEENIKDKKNAIKFGRKYEKWEKMVERDLEKWELKRSHLKNYQ